MSFDTWCPHGMREGTGKCYDCEKAQEVWAAEHKYKPPQPEQAQPSPEAVEAATILADKGWLCTLSYGKRIAVPRAAEVIQSAINKSSSRQPEQAQPSPEAEWIKDTAYKAAHDFYNDNGPAYLSLSETRERFRKFLASAIDKSRSRQPERAQPWTVEIPKPLHLALTIAGVLSDGFGFYARDEETYGKVVASIETTLERYLYPAIDTALAQLRESLRQSEAFALQSRKTYEETIQQCVARELATAAQLQTAQEALTTVSLTYPCDGGSGEICRKALAALKPVNLPQPPVGMHWLERSDRRGEFELVPDAARGKPA